MGRSLAVALFCAGCSASGSSTYNLCGTASVPTDLDSVRIVLLDATLGELSSIVVLLTDETDGSVRDWPTDVNVPGVEGAEYVRGIALLDETSVAQFDRYVPSLGEGGLTVDLVFDVDCLQVSCPLGQTCVDAECVLAPDHRDEPLCEASP